MCSRGLISPFLSRSLAHSLSREVHVCTFKGTSNSPTSFRSLNDMYDDVYDIWNLAKFPIGPNNNWIVDGELTV